MVRDVAPSISTTAYQKVSNYDEIFMQHSLQFGESLKDLRNLRKQLYSAAEYFESSYGKNDRQQIVIESSKDYVAKALVNTVDHLGSVADKLNKFLNEKANEFSATNIRFSCIEQRLTTFQGFNELRGVSQHSLMMEAPKHHKQSNRNGIPCSQYDMRQLKQDNPFAKAFLPARVNSELPFLRKGHSVVSSSESSPRLVNFSFMRVMSKKESGKRSISPLRFPLKRSGSVANRSVSQNPSDNKQRSPTEPRRATSVRTKHEMTNREREIGESHAKRSKHLFKALLNAHRSRKENRVLDRL